MGFNVSYKNTKVARTPEGKQLEENLFRAQMKIWKEENPTVFHELMQILTDVDAGH